MARDGTGGKTHVKYISVDGISIIGSMNLDIQSWKYSGELSMVIKDRPLNETLNKNIFQDEFIQGLPYSS
ncbi:phospholipase D-like domain-containing protein [Vibrio pectenicida]|uniref:phospholipase D-like domain-containing protein n=1 Tax=Vibrio pectenicida TaxID=62763 RepID=UPI003B9AFF2D